MPENSGRILKTITTQLFGNLGGILLGLVFTLACLTTSIWLIITCGQYLSKIIPRFSYKKWMGILCFTGMILANLGLNQINSISLPILTTIYPLTIVLIIYVFFA